MVRCERGGVAVPTLAGLLLGAPGESDGELVPLPRLLPPRPAGRSDLWGRPVYRCPAIGCDVVEYDRDLILRRAGAAAPTGRAAPGAGAAHPLSRRCAGSFAIVPTLSRRYAVVARGSRVWG